jgi:hypothetical protein
MKGYVACKRGRWYAVIYEGLDPVTGRERRRWHPAGTDRAKAERLAARLAAEEQGRADAARALTFGSYLTGQWLPAKKLQLHQHLPRLRTQRAAPHRARARKDRPTPAALHPHRGALRPAPHP